MDKIILDEILKYGIFCILFVGLLFRVEKLNEKREEKYQKTIDQLTSILNDYVKDTNEEIKELKENIKILNVNHSNMKLITGGKINEQN